ncbi:hypothetical protein LUZ63_008867 [Rhynchospora breviuscula]|uniref:Uncharacterized protein n=1 Tax=Rhynchospora breviuscula TaxID=2022672 RepID=A0A9Q0CDY5_9POAL|nr:hypothetical protein LUZ63_008867 [Rhynchospora breviuscula]
MMSLVEYDSSDSDEEAPEPHTDTIPTRQAPPSTATAARPPTVATPLLPRTNENPVVTSSNTVPASSSSTIPARSSNTSPASSLPSLDELPDAEFLLGPQNGSRKRESNGNVVVPSQQKFPRGRAQSSVALVRNARASTTGMLPPQLTGRSNVVTEDISKLFVNRDRNDIS